MLNIPFHLKPPAVDTVPVTREQSLLVNAALFMGRSP